MDLWMKTLQEGGSFNATTAIIIETATHPQHNNTAEADKLYLKKAATRAKTLQTLSDKTLPPCYVSKKDRADSRSLASIPSLGSLQTDTDGFANNIFLAWKLGRLATASSLFNVSIDESVMLPGFSQFSARLSDKKIAIKIGYLPLIPESPTNPAVHTQGRDDTSNEDLTCIRP